VVEGQADPRLGMEEKLEGSDGWRCPTRLEGAPTTGRGATTVREEECGHAAVREELWGLVSCEGVRRRGERKITVRGL
jgi:hypothetical protein